MNNVKTFRVNLRCCSCINAQLKAVLVIVIVVVALATNCIELWLQGKIHKSNLHIKYIFTMRNHITLCTSQSNCIVTTKHHFVSQSKSSKCILGN